MAKGEYIITEMFEEAVAEYTGAKHAVAVDSCSNALFLSLTFQICSGVLRKGDLIIIPCHTYMSVPCSIRNAGLNVQFSQGKAEGTYKLVGSNVIDSALRFTHDMYVAGYFMCLSFTGPYKHLNLGKGGMILTDNDLAYGWFKRARNSGRGEVPYQEDNFVMLGWNMYMLPEVAAKGLREMRRFYDFDGNPKTTKDIELEYPDLSNFKVYTQ